MNVYCYKNKIGDFWYQPQFMADAPESMKKTISRMVLIDAEKFKANHLDEVDLYFLGTFDDDAGKFKLLESPKFLVDCRSVFTQVTEALKHGGE